MRRIGALVMLAATVAGGCKEEDREPQGPAPPAQVERAVAGAAARARVKLAEGARKVGDALRDGKALTPEAHEALILALASCEVKGDHVDPKCPAKQALHDASNRSQTIAGFAGQGAALGRKLIGHASPAVRLEAAGLMWSFFGTDASSRAAMVEAAGREQHTGVLRSMLDTVANDGGKDPKVAELLLASARHADPRVRLKAVYAISSSWNRTMRGQIEALIALARDPDLEVRAAACEYGGRLGNEAFLPTLERGTASAKVDPEYYGDCMAGLIAMWANYPFFETGSEKAYRLTLRRLTARPRTEHAPPWGIYGDLSYLADPSHDKAAKWRAAHRWFKPAELRKALGSIIVDPAAGWMARTGALEAAVALGATRAELGAWRKRYRDGAPSSDGHVVRALDKVLASAR
jgi:hypothetical protein